MINLFDLQSWDQGPIQNVTSELKKCSRDNQGPSPREVSLGDSNHSSDCYLLIYKSAMTSRKGSKDGGGGVGEVQMWRQRQPSQEVHGETSVVIDVGNWLATGIDWKTLKDLTF